MRRTRIIIRAGGAAGHGSRRGFTLMEALMAAAILLIIVTAVTAAVSAGQQNALEARLRITAVLAAEELLGRIHADTFDDLPSWHKYAEEPGVMTDAAGHRLPMVFGNVGREATVEWTTLAASNLGVLVRGYMVRVEAFDAHGRTLVKLSRFIPEPPEATE